MTNIFMKNLSLQAAAMLLTVSTCFGSASAKTVATDSLVQNYMRSSIYTILLNSKTMNDYFEKETKEADAASNGTLVVDLFLGGAADKREANETHKGSIFTLPAEIFPTVEIPNQFNEHNLGWRVVNYDSIRGLVNESDIAKFAEKKKKSMFGGLGGLIKDATGVQSEGMDNSKEYDRCYRAVVDRFFSSNNVPALVMAKWFDYDPQAENHWAKAGETVTRRGAYNFTDEELARRTNDQAVRNKIANTGFNMIDHTFVLATNLRFTSYQAYVARIKQATKGGLGVIGGWTGVDLSPVDELVGGITENVGIGAGDGFVVEATTALYKLKWNDDIAHQVGEKLQANASLEDLVNSGLCQLEFRGYEKSKARVHQKKNSTTPFSTLLRRGIQKAINGSIAELQGTVEEFRTVVPVTGCDDAGNIYAAIGTKEGLVRGDEYELLEAQEDELGNRTYKAFGTIKPIPEKIWVNDEGTEEALAEAGEITPEQREALDRGYSVFKGKKGDYTGYYLRLKKKAKTK